MRGAKAVIAAILMLSSCTHKELCYDHPHTVEIEVEFDWSKAPDANPETMSVYLFEEGAEEGERYEFTDNTSGRIRVLPGRYSAICINSDTRNIKFADRSSYENCVIITKDAGPNEGITPMSLLASGEITKGEEGERLAMSPDSVWTARIDNIVADSLCKKLTFTPEKAFGTIQIFIRDVENMQYLTAANGTLSSMSEGWYPGQNVLTDEKVTIPFNLEINKNENVLSGELRIFGHCPEEENEHKLTLYCQMVDGSIFTESYEVTKQIHEDENGIIYIVLDRLTLPKPSQSSGGGGFKNPSVGGWESVNIGIAM